MNYLTNPYILKIMELNKDIEGLKLDKSVLEYELQEYKRYPVETVCVIDIENQLQDVINNITVIEAQIVQVSKFIGK